MTASSYAWGAFLPYYGRLNGVGNDRAWCPESETDRTAYLQVDMGALYSVCAVATQGDRDHDERTNSYKLQLSLDGKLWKSYKENNAVKVLSGNTDRNSIVRHSLTTEIKARFVRFYPVTYYSYPCMRVEIYVRK